MDRTRRIFAKQKDPYAGVDLGLALRVGSVLWIVGLGIAIVLWPLSPPDRAIGEGGWVLTAAITMFGLAGFFAFRSERIPWTFNRLYLSAFVAVAAIAIVQWLAGGVGAPYDRLLLLTVVYVASIHPARRIAGLLAFVGLALAAPYVYDAWNPDEAAGSLAAFIIWCAVAGFIHVLMSHIRAREIRMHRGTQQAQEEARIDELTGIGNRRAFEEAIDIEISRAGRMKMPLSLAMGDIADFKRINDEWGHVEGDECLRTVARSLADALRKPDRCFRWGGDEFALLLPGTPREGANQVAERLRLHVATGPARPDGEAVMVRFGTAELVDGMDARQLVEAADLALLGAKSVSA